MQFSPYVLLRHPSYDLSYLDVFSVHAEDYAAIEEAIEDRRKHFLSFITSKDLLLSLPFSSKTVYQAIPHYEFHAAVKIRKKEKQTERALMKYLSRMSLNPSPLAAFAKSQFVSWEWEAMAPGNKFELSLSLDQRKEFFDLCYCDVGLQKYMRYRLNPSLHWHSNGFVYLHRVGEEESRIALEFDQEFEDMYKSMRKKDFTFEQFVSETNYDVNDFLEAQLIVPSYPAYQEDEFVIKLIKDVNERHNLSFKIEDVIGIYKDAFTDIAAIEQQKHWESQLTSYAKKLDVGLDQKLYSERSYYLNTYSEEKIEKPAFDRDSVSRDIMGIVNIANRCMNMKANGPLGWESVYEPASEETPSFDISEIALAQKSDFVLQLNLDRGEEAIAYDSLGVMLRFSDTELPRVVNVSTPFGKFYAPSLGLANTEVKKNLKEWVLDSGQKGVNLKDASLHNKNRAHGFLPELNNFGLDFHSPIEDRVSIDFLQDGTVVNSDTKDPLLTLNLGIEEHSSRSPYYQNLYLQSNVLPNLPVFINTIQKERLIQIDEFVSCAPKIITEHLILGFQKWYALKKAFEVFQDAKIVHVEQLNLWRKKYQIPRIVECQIGSRKSIYLDFNNPWSVDSFLKMIRKMDTTCVFEDIGFKEEIKDKRLYEAYFEIRF